MKLSELKVGEKGIVTSVSGEKALRQHILDMGVIPGQKMTVVKFAPMGDPIEFRVNDYELTLRVNEAENIEAELLNEDDTVEQREQGHHNGSHEHPGLGEGGRYHVKESEHPLSPDETVTFALAGNQNSGKTTLFNQLTGSNQHVGNFPGVTVDRKTGVIKGQKNTEITDLPGIYSLSPYTSEEIVSRQFIIDEKPKGIINIVDVTNIERNLYLSMQLMELDTPMVLALNMMDELTGNGGSVRINEMEDMLGIPVVPISASKGQGITELVDHAMHVAYYQERPGRTDFCDKDENGGAVHRCLHAIMHLIMDHAEKAGIPVRFAATKLVEGDPYVVESLKLQQNELEAIEHIIVQMEEERGLDRSAAIADMRFSFINKLVKATVVKPVKNKEYERSQRMDRILTGKYTAIPVFILIMGLVFYLTFNVIGAWLQGILETGIDILAARTDLLLENWGINKAIHSLIIDGIFSGVGSVLSFLPIIVVLFFFLSILEDTGYMARIAFVMDKFLRKLGLSGRSIVPMLIGFGCSVPAVMSSRTLPSERDRKMTIMMVPFMSCTAKLPIYGFFTQKFFPEYSGLIMVGLYVLGIVVGIVLALVTKNSIFKGEPVPFVMELPNYRMPSAGNVLRLLWEKAKDFLYRAFTIIFMASIVIWFLKTFDFGLNMVSDPSLSILAKIAGVIAPVFRPMGFGDWRVATALITGFLAKESVVAVLNVLYGTGTQILSILSGGSAAALLVFCLLYTPCVAAIASVKRELGAKWALNMVILQCVIAWIVSMIVYLISLVF
ncbi:MAG: ferrous iron transport protein B [Oscillospiraceae bacterium]|nr:ferrous iron transport protein B [Oscillospiraceae bacterium]